MPMARQLQHPSAASVGSRRDKRPSAPTVCVYDSPVTGALYDCMCMLYWLWTVDRDDRLRLWRVVCRMCVIRVCEAKTSIIICPRPPKKRVTP
eukprot:scaffold23755_cov163-Isochrysis_galbana.AAC.2